MFPSHATVVGDEGQNYWLCVFFSEPAGTGETHVFVTAVWNAGAGTGRVRDRIAPILGIPPRFDQPVLPFPRLAQAGSGQKQGSGGPISRWAHERRGAHDPLPAPPPPRPSPPRSEPPPSPPPPPHPPPPPPPSFPPPPP